MSDYYVWTSSGDCDVCNQMEGVHVAPPQRPHPHCQCTLIAVHPDDVPGRCVSSEPFIINGAHGGNHDYDGDEVTLRFTVDIVCRDASVIEIEVSYEDLDPQVDSMPADAQLAWLDYVGAIIDAKALEEAESACPSCSEGPPPPEP